ASSATSRSAILTAAPSRASNDHARTRFGTTILDISWSGRCPRWNLEMRLFVWFEWTAFAASVFILLRVANGVATFLYLFGVDPFEPCVIAHGNFAKNGRGDLVEG